MNVSARWLSTVLLFAVPGLLHAQTTTMVDTIRVEVHGHEMVLYSAGSGPVVVMESGGGSSAAAWRAVVPDLAKHARVITYDRPGYGLSEACDSARHAQRITSELRTALTAAGITGPFTMVGWSYGGALVRVFAGNYPDDVPGMVLVDPANEDFYARAAFEAPDAYTAEEEAYFPALFRDSTRSAEQRELAGYEPSMEQARASDALHRTPTILLIAGNGATGSAADPISVIWTDQLRRWAATRPGMTVETVEGAGHHIAKDKPAAVVDAVLRSIRRR